MGVKIFHSGMATAPALSGAVGSRIAVLNACLVDGLGSKSVSSLVISGGVATATVSGGHSFSEQVIAKVSGATVTGGVINGEHRVSAVGLNTISWVTALADQTASGSITIEVAPLGWNRMTGTNKAAYQSAALGATGCWLRVDDTGDRNARVRGYRSMTDVDTGVSPFPTDAQLSGGGYWRGGNATSDSVAKPWFIAGDEKFFIFCIGVFGTAYHSVHTFGDFLSPRAGDSTPCVLTAYPIVAANTGADNGQGSLANHSTQVLGNWVMQSYSGIGGSVAAYNYPSSYMVGTNPIIASGSASGPNNYPNPTDNGILLSKPCVIEAGNFAYRGEFPGAIWIVSNGAAALNDGDFLDGSGIYAGRKLRVVRIGAQNNTNLGAMLVDITGPWR